MNPFKLVKKTIKKKKRNVLTLKQRIEVIEKLQQGASGTSLAEDYGISEAAISKIKVNKEKVLANIHKYQSSQQASPNPINLSSKKTVRTAQDSTLEKAVLLWFTQQRNLGHPINGPILRMKAKDINFELNGDNNFKASSGWLSRFCNRNGIKEYTMKGELLSADHEAAEEYKKEVLRLIEGYDKDHIYNADEAGLFYRLLPSKTLAFKSEVQVSGHKPNKDRVTGILCANASGSQKIPLTIVGKSKTPRCLKGRNMDNFAAKYFNQANAWVNREIFDKWVKEVFEPAANKFHTDRGTYGPIMLLVDGAPGHFDFQYKNIKISYLPPNTTSLIQPMDQQVIANWKRFYRGAQLKQLLEWAKDRPLTKCYTLIDIKFVLEEAALAWDSVSNSVLKSAWNNLLGNDEGVSEQADPNIEPIRSICSRIAGLDDICDNEIIDWLDSGDQGYPVLDQEQIIKLTKNGKGLEECFSLFEGTEEDGEDSEETEVDIYDASIDDTIQKIKVWASNLKTADQNKVQEFTENIDFFYNFNKNLASNAA